MTNEQAAKWVKFVHDVLYEDKDEEIREALDMAIEALQREPILCKECSHAERADTPLTAMWCRRFNLHDMAVGEDDYCSFGERREP